MEQRHRELNDPQIVEQIHATKQKLNKLLDDQVEFKLKYIKQRYYENVPRAKKKYWHGNCVNNNQKGQFSKSETLSRI